MIVLKELKRVYQELAQSEHSQISIGDSTVVVHMFDQRSRLNLSAIVYQGHDYIPQSVRDCLEKINPFGHQDIKTSLNLDESKFQISLRYFGTLDTLSKQQFVSLLEEFGELSDKWRNLLDENDKRDLIHVRHK